MLKKIIAVMLVMMLLTSNLMVNFAGPGKGKANGLENGNGNNGQGNAFGYGHGGYDDEEASDWYRYGNRVDFARLDESTEGKLMVQYYNVSDISWKSNSSRELWTRSNMFSENRVVGSPVLRSVDEHNGYGDYYDDYIFYRNGNYTEGPISKTAQRIWGYYKPDDTGYYKFRVTSDDGHYFKMFNDDIFNNPAYDHYNDGTYANQWNRFYNNGQLELDNMIITSNVVGTTEWRYMREDEIYPVYMEYFNWGGSGKFEFEEAYSEYNPSSNPRFDEVDDDNLFARIINETSQNGESGIDITVDNGVRTVHAYDDFYDGVIDSEVWSNINRFYENNGTLNSYSGLASIQLKNEYADYDAYKIQVSLVNIDDQTMKYSNGGIGVSDGNSIWVNQLQVTQKSDRKWYRYFDVTKYGTVNHQLPNGVHYKDTWFNKNNNGKWSWRNKSLKMVVDAEKLTNSEAYDVTVSIYEIKNNDFKLLTTVNTVTEDSNLDFNKIYLADIMPYGGWYVSFDDFDFVAVKDTRFTSLELSHSNNDYILDWQAVDGAEKYIVYYGDEENTVGTKYGSDIDATTTSLIIPDNLSAYNSKYFKVVAIMSDKEIGSNAVKLNGDVTMSVLQGRFDESDYILSWNKFNGTDKYQLYYGDTPTSIDTLLPDSDNMNPNTTSKRLENMESTSPYYNKYFQLRAIDDDVTYYSNAVKIEDNLRLGLEHDDDFYKLKWLSDATFTSYEIYYGDDETSISTLYETVGRNIREVKIADTSILNEKFFVVVGKSGSRRVTSNHVELNGNVTIAPLTWQYNDDGQQVLNWGEFDNPEIMTLYYGDAIDDMTTVMSEPENLPNGTTQFMTNESKYLNKYIQLKFVKDGITYYTNVVRSAQFSDASATVKASTTDAGEKDLLIEWTNDPEATGYEIRYKTSATDDEGILIIGDLPEESNSYKIEDIYGENRKYLDKEIIVIAKYGETVRVHSQPVVTKEIVFDSFEGILSALNSFEMTWTAPKLKIGADEQDVASDYYTIRYSNNSTIVRDVVTGAESLNELEFRISDVTNESNSAGNAYYNKYFVVSAYIDGVSYESNIIRSLPQNNLTVKHINNSYLLEWQSVSGATAYKVYYGDTELDVYTQYGDSLASNKLSLEIPDTDALSDKYFRIVALLDDTTTISSNTVLLQGDQLMSRLTGVSNEDNYDLSWNVFDGAESYTLVYMDTIDGMESVIGNFENMSTDTLSKVITNLSTTDYNNKFIRLVAKKSGIEFKSNVVRASRFADAYGHVTLDGTKKDFDFKWTKIANAIDYIVYYKNSDGIELEYPEDLNANSTQITTIRDIENSNYNGMTFRVEAVFDGDVRVTSGAITHESTVSTKLTSVLNTDTDDYTLSWTGFEGAEKFRIVYGNQAPILDGDAVSLEWLDASQLNEVLNGVSDGSPYYHKHFKVQILKDDIYYDSNTVYSGEAPVLSLDKYYGDDFKLHWLEVENADSIIVRYSEEESSDNYSTFELPLSGNSTTKGIVDVLTDNKKYDNKYFKVVAVFNGFEIDSNTVFITTEVESPVISGRYSNNDYNITWDLIKDATSIDIIHVRRDKDNNNELLGISVISDGHAGTDTSFEITNAESSAYYEEYVQIRATIEDDKGNKVIVFSNEVFVEEAIIDGTNPTDGGNTVDQPSIEQGEFDGDIVKLRMGNEFEVAYSFLVNDDMYNPYFKVTLKGNEYLSYDKIIAGLYNQTTKEKIAVRLVMDVDDTTGDIIVYVHPKGDASKLLSGGEYKVTLDSTIDVIDEEKVYEALYDLPNYDSSITNTPKKWELPYYINELYDKSESDVGVKLDHDMLIKYEVEWNSSNVEANGDVRENTKELFKLNIQVKDKRKLPNSI